MHKQISTIVHKMILLNGVLELALVTDSQAMETIKTSSGELGTHATVLRPIENRPAHGNQNRTFTTGMQIGLAPNSVMKPKPTNTQGFCPTQNNTNYPQPQYGSPIPFGNYGQQNQNAHTNQKGQQTQHGTKSQKGQQKQNWQPKQQGQQTQKTPLGNEHEHNKENQCVHQNQQGQQSLFEQKPQYGTPVPFGNYGQQNQKKETPQEYQLRRAALEQKKLRELAQKKRNSRSAKMNSLGIDIDSSKFKCHILDFEDAYFGKFEFNRPNPESFKDHEIELIQNSNSNLVNILSVSIIKDYYVHQVIDLVDSNILDNGDVAWAEKIEHAKSFRHLRDPINSGHNTRCPNPKGDLVCEYILIHVTYDLAEEYLRGENNIFVYCKNMKFALNQLNRVFTHMRSGQIKENRLVIWKENGTGLLLNKVELNRGELDNLSSYIEEKKDSLESALIKK